MKFSKLFFLLACMVLTSCDNSNSNQQSESITEQVSETVESIESNESSELESESSESESESSEPPSESIESEESESEEEKDPVTVEYNAPSSSAKKVTISQLVAKGSTSDYNNLYSITGTVQFPYNYTYGNFDLVDETGYIVVWGLSKNASSMSKSGSKYSYSNDKTFNSINLKAGDVITMECIYTPYVYGSGYSKPEVSGYIISKTIMDVAPITGRNYTHNEPYNGSYYNSVDGLEGSDLLRGLHNLMLDTHDTYVSYSSLTNTLKRSDPGSSSSEAKCFYSGKSTSKFSREHVWAQSLSGSSSSSSTNLYGETHGGSDIHHIRPVISSYNSLRSNAAFGYVYGPKSGMKTVSHINGDDNYLTGSVFEPVDEIKGDVARIVMYMYMHYSSSIMNDGSKYSYLGAMNIYYIMGPNYKEDCFKLLREWNALDPVDDYERNRNEVGYSYQGNRNPFVDHPSYADKIWG